MPRKAKTSAKTSAVLVPQRHGGALQVGNPGNGGGPGRPPSLIRERCRGSFEQRIRVLEEIVDGEPVQKVEMPGPDGKMVEAKASASPGDRIRAMDVLGKYGPGQVREVSTDEVRERLRQTVEVLRAELPGDRAAHIVSQLREIWST